MALEDWQVEYLGTVPSLTGMTAEDTRAIIGKVLFSEEPENLPEVVTRLHAGSDSEVKRRFYEIGKAHGGAVTLASGSTIASASASASTPDEHPEIAAFSAMADEIMRTPNVRTLHGYAQVALLNAIQRAAETAETPEDIRLLADAYLTLPSPGEDDLDD